jgi:hypothetical protein
MNLQNGYKVIYEKAADGKRIFYASKTGVCDPTVDTQLGEAFDDAEYRGKMIYEYKGSFYVTTGATPSYDEEGKPTDERLTAFDEVFIKAEAAATASIEDEEDLDGDTSVNDPSGDDELSGDDDEGATTPEDDDEGETPDEGVDENGEDDGEDE